MGDDWHEPVVLQKPTFEDGQHGAGTVPSSSDCRQDTERGTGQTPAWFREHPDPKYRYASMPEQDERPLEKKYRDHVNTVRQQLKQHVANSSMCKRFGGRQ